MLFMHAMADPEMSLRGLIFPKFNAISGTKKLKTKLLNSLLWYLIVEVSVSLQVVLKSLINSHSFD